MKLFTSRFAHLYGTRQDDTLLGTEADEFIVDLDGDDIVRAGDGDDMLHNSRGNDRLFGEAGDDEFGFHPKTATKMDPGRTVWIDGGDGDDTVNFYRNDDGFSIRERGDKHIVTFNGDQMRVILKDVEHVVFLNETWDL